MNVTKIPIVALAAACLVLPACNKIEEFYEGTQLTANEQSDSSSSGSENHAEPGHNESEHASSHSANQNETHSESHGEAHEEGHGGEHHPAHKILVTSAVAKDVISTQRYVCQIHSRRHIEVRALEGGYLEAIPINEGQSVRQGDLMFKILPVLYQARLNSDLAEASLAQIEFDNTKKLFDQNIVSQQEVALAQAKLTKAEAKVQLAKAERDFADVRAPFNGIVDRLMNQQGSLIEEGDILTTLSDNEVMWVYFNVPEARYLEYKAAMDENTGGEDLGVELILANHQKFPVPGQISAIEADFNNETGNIAFRSDFANPRGLLRHGQTGTVLLNHLLKDAVVIPQRATYEILDKRYAFVVDADNVIHQREIKLETELDDIFVIREGLQPGERIVLEGIRQVRDGDQVVYEFKDPNEVLSHLKNHAE
ncbi:efflux RND transporter periplasmic adaptor subunit [Neorhodopirellula lusitana]|uniref:efflux RND transporter periplasmic adaptor subunit n=1 Tax=Neorhodopirellula lusitana TaxID=445327 RepID=UPI00384F4F3A